MLHIQYAKILAFRFVGLITVSESFEMKAAYTIYGGIDKKGKVIFDLAFRRLKFLALLFHQHQGCMVPFVFTVHTSTFCLKGTQSVDVASYSLS
jgi:hypothetical protein